jgi:hypothetical protein
MQITKLTISKQASKQRVSLMTFAIVFLNVHVTHMLVSNSNYHCTIPQRDSSKVTRLCVPKRLCECVVLPSLLSALFLPCMCWSFTNIMYVRLTITLCAARDFTLDLCCFLFHCEHVGTEIAPSALSPRSKKRGKKYTPYSNYRKEISH